MPESITSRQLPIPISQLHYADPELNPQECPLTACIDRLQYPTLGCPALLVASQPPVVLLSLPPDETPKEVQLRLIDRHGKSGDRGALAIVQLEQISSPCPEDPYSRKVWRLRCELPADCPKVLYDLVLIHQGGAETQPNAIRVFSKITGEEQVVFCGDSQYNLKNHACLAKFVETMNEIDAAWIAMIGDICDCGVKGYWNTIELGATAAEGTVTNYYEHEYQESWRLLQRLNKPIFLVPGNHDGISANTNYKPGTVSTVVTGPDPDNDVAYDGLHHFRRTFGPLYFRFDWAKTRYLCLNSFEHARQLRLGYHAIVANWGGWMQPTQVQWLEEELEDAEKLGLRTVLLMHHDPRGGSQGLKLGRFHTYREYRMADLWGILRSYLPYLKHKIGRTWQQEWMAEPDKDLNEHPVRSLLETLIDFKVWAVIMGHDNQNWIESYLQGENLLEHDHEIAKYAVVMDRHDDDDDLDRATHDLAAKVATSYKTGRWDEVVQLLAKQSEKVRDYAISRAAAEYLAAAEAESAGDAVSVTSVVSTPAAPSGSAPTPAVTPGDLKFGWAHGDGKDWGLRVLATMHFIHVDDVGAYRDIPKYIHDYGYVLANLSGGAPKTISSFFLDGQPGGEPIDLIG